MRKNFTFILMGLIMLFVLSGKGIAQDTLVVEQGLNKISQAFAADTLAGVDLNTRVYKLQLGGTYLQDEQIITSPGQPLNIVGETGDGKPPVIQPFVDQSGSSPGTLFLIKDNFTFKNAIVSMMDNLGSKQSVVVHISADSINLELDNVYVELCRFIVVRCDGNHGTIKVRDCKFFNNYQDQNPPNGRGIDTRKTMVDTIIYENNTFYNMRSAFTFNKPHRYVKINHNTMMNTTMINLTGDPGQGRWFGEFTNNLMVDVELIIQPLQWLYGDELKFWSPADSVIAIGDSIGTINGQNLFDIDSLDVETPWPTESLHLTVENNNYHYTQPVVDYFEDNYGDSTDQYSVNWVFLNDYDLAYTSRHPDLYTVEQATNLEAGIVKRSYLPDYTEDYLIPHLAQMGVQFYREPVPRSDWFWQADDETLIDDNGLAVVEWPVPQDFSYTNETLKTAGNDGFPLGDLNWFPDKKAEWESGSTTGVNSKEVAAASISVYPNPLSSGITTTVEFSNPEGRSHSFVIYSITGSVVRTINDIRTESFTFNKSELENGMYIYELRSETNVLGKGKLIVK